MLTYIASIDWKGHEMERPFMRIFVEGETPEAATEAAGRACAKDETCRSVAALQPILDAIRERIDGGTTYTISRKDEGSTGPVWIIDADALQAETGGKHPLGRPFGSEEPNYITALPWMKRSDAKRLAAYLGLTLEES